MRISGENGEKGENLGGEWRGRRGRRVRISGGEWRGRMEREKVKMEKKGENGWGKNENGEGGGRE